MGAPVTGITRQAAFLEWTGGRYNIWMKFHWVEHETGACSYLIEAHNIGTGNWDQISVIGKGIRFCNVNMGSHGPPSWAYNQVYNQIRITCTLIGPPPDPSPGVTLYTPVWQTTKNKAAATNQSIAFSLAGGGLQVNLNFDDPSYYVYESVIHVFNVSQGNKEIYARGPGEGTPLLAINQNQFFQTAIGFVLTGDNYPNQGDIIQFRLAGLCGNGKYPQNVTYSDGQEAIWSTAVYFPVNFPFISLSGTQSNPFSVDLRTTPGISGDPYSATYATTGTLPPGLSLSSSGIISGTPSTIGTWNFHVTTTTPNGDIGGGDVQIVIAQSTVPIILNPMTVICNQWAPIVPIQIIATNNPSSYAIASGTLPTGLSLNTTTGVISGTPTAIQSPSGVNITATNSSGTGPAVTFTFSVIALPLPVITSPSSATAYRGESFNYQIVASNAPIAFAANVTNPPPDLFSLGLSCNAQTGLISGVLNIANVPGIYPLTLRAQNHTGYSAPFTLTLTVADRIPVIGGDLSQSTIAFQPFTYQIIASGYPTSYGATNLPFGLNVDPVSGIISGETVYPGVYSITVSATNSAGTGTGILQLDVILLRPVIDISITAGKAITCETGIPIVFQPVASNSPTIWAAAPVPDGFTIDGNAPVPPSNVASGPTGKLAGTFINVGLYGIVFIADNLAGPSDVAIFYFLVEAGPLASASQGTGLDIWIDLQDGSVSILPPGATLQQTQTTTQDGTVTQTQQTVAAPTSEAVLWSKRGDTMPLTIRFHKNGTQVTLTGLTSLIFGVREDFDSPYAILYDGFILNDDGSYGIFPNYGNNPEIDFEIDDTEEFLELMAEVQWEIGDINNPDGPPPFSRRSSQTFTNRIYRDVIHPDEPS